MASAKATLRKASNSPQDRRLTRPSPCTSRRWSPRTRSCALTAGRHTQLHRHGDTVTIDHRHTRTANPARRYSWSHRTSSNTSDRHSAPPGFPVEHPDSTPNPPGLNSAEQPSLAFPSPFPLLVSLGRLTPPGPIPFAVRMRAQRPCFLSLPLWAAGGAKAQLGQRPHERPHH